MTDTGSKPIHSSKLVGRMVNGVPKGTRSYIAAKTRELKEEKEMEKNQMTKLPGKILTHHDEWCDFDIYDKDGKGWCLQTLNPKRSCDLCDTIGSYTLDSNTPSHDVAFCIDHIVEDWKEIA